MIHILIPTYNRHVYLKSLLTDLSQQHFKDFDVTVCSDGFDLTVLEMIEDFDNKNYQPYHYIHTVERANDWGLSPRKLLIDSIKDFDSHIIFIDDDNAICPQYLERLSVDRLSNIISYCDIFMADETINGERILPGQEIESFEYGYIDPLSCLIPTHIAKICFHKWGHDRDQDFNFLIECSKYCKLKYIPYVLGVHR